MKTKKTYAIFGLGRYGTAVARELVENGMEVSIYGNESLPMQRHICPYVNALT